MRRAILLPLCVLVVLSFARAIERAGAEETALDRYIAAADPAYQWKLGNTIKGDGATTYVLDLTSQTWRSEADASANSRSVLIRAPLILL